MKEETFLNEASSASQQNGEGPYQTGFVRWRAADDGFSDWALNGVRRTAAGTLELDPQTLSAGSDPYPAGTYSGGNYYNGGAFFVGEATSPEMEVRFSFKNAIPSWNASTPAGTWLEIKFRAQYSGERWSKWYSLGIWASDESTIRRHSVQAQDDADGSVAADTFISSNQEETGKFQLKLRLLTVDSASTPGIRNVAVAFSTAPPKAPQHSSGRPAAWDTVLDMLQCSQMVYPNGGNVWCSPMSLSMVLSYWDGYTGPREPRVRSTVEGVYDWIYDGHGNWPFNTAYAATFGYEAYVARFTSLERAEEYILTGVPVIISIAWGKGQLKGVNTEASNGHLMVLVGFDQAGNPIVNDPDAPDDEQVQRVYLRSEFEPLWLRASGGTVYLIYPEGKSVPEPA